MIDEIKDIMMIVDPSLSGKEKEKAEKYEYASALAFATQNRLVNMFYDYDSYKKLDKKIEVLERLFNGENPDDFWDDFVDILEKYPTDENVEVKW